MSSRGKKYAKDKQHHAGGSNRGLSAEDREALDEFRKKKKKKEERKSKRTMEKIADKRYRKNRDRSSHSDTSSTSHDSSDCSSDSATRRKRKKRAAQRKKKAEKLRTEMDEGKRAQDELDQLKKAIEDEAKKKVKDATAGSDSPATDTSVQSEAKGDASFTFAQIKELMRFAKEKATPPRTPSNNSNKNSKPPRNVFANIVTQKSTVQIEELDEVQDTRREIISWLEDKLEKAEEIQSLALGMGSSRECINICNGLSRRCASKYFTTDAHLDILKLMIASTKIGTVCKKANTILSELLQAIGTRGIPVEEVDLGL